MRYAAAFRHHKERNLSKALWSAAK